MTKAVTKWVATMAMAGVLSPVANAQFHKKKESGETEINRQTQAVIQAGQRQAQQQGNSTATGQAGMKEDLFGKRNANTAIFKPELVWNGTDWIKTDAKFALMDYENPFIFSKLVNHSDGSYTSTKRDIQHLRNGGKGQKMIQETFSANDVLLNTREVSMNAEGFPGEVIIRDAIGRFRFRGLMVYERTVVTGQEGGVIQRLKEEQIFDENKKLLRRIVHNYDANGGPLQGVIHDYVTDIPEDIQLVIYKGDAQIDPLLTDAGEGMKWVPVLGFVKKSPRNEQSDTAQPAGAEGERKAKGFLKGIRLRNKQK